MASASESGSLGSSAFVESRDAAATRDRADPDAVPLASVAPLVAGAVASVDAKKSSSFLRS